MKTPHLTSGETKLACDAVQRTVGEKLREVYDASVASLLGCQRAGNGSTPSDTRATERRRGTTVSAGEDPIRRVMFLGPWSHT
ncbi:hypothetical protein QJS04_geneDACA007299 [Acorus gramineus]|uniref:Uncharacterized protein n=1 Tax=Acorus gramineus TaxID=55184 RepID=A0AAV9BN04_ACOGR|nr:hypothetical protein QJS04_geneDACA007299 [Acorus gramineus]